MNEFETQNPFDEQPLPPGEGVFSGPNLTEEMRLGQACRFLLDSEPYKLVTVAMQERIWAGFTSSPLRDIEGLRHLRMMQKCITDMHELLEEAADTGKMAAIQLTEQQQRDTDSAASSDI